MNYEKNTNSLVPALPNLKVGNRFLRVLHMPLLVLLSVAITGLVWRFISTTVRSSQIKPCLTGYTNEKMRLKSSWAFLFYGIASPITRLHVFQLIAPEISKMVLTNWMRYASGRLRNF